MGIEYSIIFIFSIVGCLCVGGFIGKALGKLIINSINSYYENKDIIIKD